MDYDEAILLVQKAVYTGRMDGVKANELLVFLIDLERRDKETAKAIIKSIQHTLGVRA
jgi:hypothetical protein